MVRIKLAVLSDNDRVNDMAGDMLNCDPLFGPGAHIDIDYLPLRVQVGHRDGIKIKGRYKRHKPKNQHRQQDRDHDELALTPGKRCYIQTQQSA